MWSVWGQLINRDLNSFGVLPNIIETTADTTAEEYSCEGTVTFAGIALVATLGTCTAFVAKKKED